MAANVERPVRTNREPRRFAIAAVSAALIVTMVGASTVTRLPSEPTPANATAASPSNSPSPSPSQSPSQSPTASPIGSNPPSAAPVAPSTQPEGTWVAADLPPYEPAATIVPTDVDTAGVAADSAFIVRSRTDVAAKDLVRGLTVQPPIDIRVAATASASEARIEPAAPLTAGRTYRFRLEAPDGSLAGNWSFRARGPLHVVTSVPGDKANEVPLDTGIEVEFDHDGVTGAERHFSISPETPGRFETHGRTLVFVPRATLRPRTLYTVTITSGVAIAGSDQVLERDVVIEFETADPDAKPDVDETSLRLGRFLYESSPRERPVIGMQIGQWPTNAADRSLAISIHRLPTIDATMAAVRTLQAAPEWSRYSTAGVIQFGGLPKVADLSTELERLDQSGSAFARIPAKLPTGFYVFEIAHPDRPLQAVIAVTDLATYAAITSTKTVVWTNNLATGGPLAGARVSLDGRRIGTTDRDGMLVADTPDIYRDDYDGPDDGEPYASVVVRTLDGRVGLAIPGLSGRYGPYVTETQSTGHRDPERDRTWLAFSTDRTMFRSTDTVNAWGFARDRATNDVPADIELRLAAEANAWGDVDAPIARTDVTPSPSGAFAASLPIRDLPFGTYVLQLWAGTRRLADEYITVGTIGKPTYTVEVSAPRVALAGDAIEVEARVTFFDGTPVPGLDLGLTAFGGAAGTTGADGRAVLRCTPVADTPAGVTWSGLEIAPVRPEEAEILRWRDLLVYPSSVWLSGSATLAGNRLSLTGIGSAVDLAKAELAMNEGREVDPSGAPRSGLRVTATVIEVEYVRREVGRTYDFISKRSVPQYEYTTTERAVARHDLLTNQAGRFDLAVDVDARMDREFRVELSASDERGREIRYSTLAAGPPDADSNAVVQPFLVLRDESGEPATNYRFGETMTVTFERDGVAEPSRARDRYLFLVSSLGLQDATIARMPRLVTSFDLDDGPSQSVMVVHFDGSTFERPSFAAFLAASTEDRAIKVEFETDAARYRPGGNVSLGIRTRDASGRPVSASVVLSAVDEKLYEIGAAMQDDPLAELYEPVGDGVLATYGSHQLPIANANDGMGDTTGGGRDDFRDSVLFRLVTTGSDGRATTTFTLSDDLTSWRVNGAAMEAGIRAGTGSVSVPVGLPFFVEPAIASEYLVSDRGTIALRSFGDALRAGDRVTFDVSAPSLGLRSERITGRAFEAVSLALPALSAGRHAITISASATAAGDGRTHTDRLTRVITVIESRLTRTMISTAPLDDAYRPSGGTGITRVTIADAGRGTLAGILEALAGSDGVRADQAIAAAAAREILATSFGRAQQETADDYEHVRYQHPDGGISLFPYSSPSLELSVMIAVAVPEAVRAASLQDYLASGLDAEDVTRERKALALVGLAALDADVAGRVTSLLAEGSLTIREQLYLGLAAAESGDTSTALRIERELVTGHGQTLGDWFRLSAGTTLDDTVEATALLSMLAADLGDPVADAAAAYVRSVPSGMTLFSLAELGYVRRSLDRLPTASGRFAITVDGRRQVVELEGGAAWSISVTEGQRRSLRLERLGGALSATSAWRAPLDVTSVASHPDVSIQRRVDPAGTLSSDRLARVTVEVTFGPKALEGCYDVREQLPSGLAPLARRALWYQDNDANEPSRLAPYLVSGQLVAFCASPPISGRTVTMGYAARVVTAGTYAWEAATVQRVDSPEVFAATEATRVTIR